ncbi:MAG: multicopper oxidase domain-containing protein [Chloroflexota bacterium]|nr:multicopper oxidase domain-containing protein [Chloroflexota bacterium]MBI5703389.1 multicopper oxidase domain-containing protein [Chloroflexota bacterium]
MPAQLITRTQFSRRDFLKLGLTGTAAVALAGSRLLKVVSTAKAVDVFYTEAYPTSPLILSPFQDELPIPKALAPIPPSDWNSWASKPGPEPGKQNSFGNEKHQIWPSQIGYPDPIVYRIELRVNTHDFTSSEVLPIDGNGQPTISFDADGKSYPAGTIRSLPSSTIYGFNGTFPGPLINAEYGKPVLVRFVNRLDENPLNLDRQDFGAPDWSFLTHLHNAHTAPESDGNPNYAMNYGPRRHGYPPGSWCDNLYLNWPAGGDSREKQSFFWFHDHRMDHTGANVYKGMVGLYPIYDPEDNKDMGDETQGLHLPGVRTDNPDGSFDVAYDIPLVFYDCRLDDGVTLHNDIHDAEFPDAGNPRTHPEWWGKTFYRHSVNHGFVGDIFTVNGKAYPVLTVNRRKYRLRFLDASVSRCYEFVLMRSAGGPVAAKDLGYSGDELQGQYRIPDGVQCMQFIQIASDGGLLPHTIVRDSFELWPAKRREFIVDFTKYADGTPTQKGDVIYLTNIMKMTDGRKMNNSTRSGLDPNYKIPVLKIVIGDDAPDNSQIPTGIMRELPPMPVITQEMLDNRLIFEVQRGGFGGEIEWLVNGAPFDPTFPAISLKNPAGKSPLAQHVIGSSAVWEIRNGGGGWVHPFHLHMEEHRVIMRNGNAIVPSADHPDDASREDVINLDEGESVLVWRQFRDFVGHYVAHCHNLAHEDHAMMFGWEILPAPVTAPVADAGGPYTVDSAATTPLNGSATGTTPITYLWSASAGTFSDPTSPNPIYTAPAVTATTTITLSLKVTNAAGSNTASATITVKPVIVADTVTITSSVYRTSKKILTITATSSDPSAVLKLMPYLATTAIMYDPSLLGNTFTKSKGVWKLTLTGVPQPAAGTSGTAGLQVKSSLGGISPRTALQSVTR